MSHKQQNTTRTNLDTPIIILVIMGLRCTKSGSIISFQNFSGLPSPLLEFKMLIFSHLTVLLYSALLLTCGNYLAVASFILSSIWCHSYLLCNRIIPYRTYAWCPTFMESSPSMPTSSFEEVKALDVRKLSKIGLKKKGSACEIL